MTLTHTIQNKYNTSKGCVINLYKKNEEFKKTEKSHFIGCYFKLKDGVQAIYDEFLEWFVKNPSCEEVKIKPYCEKLTCKNYSCNIYCQELKYKIIIPKEEPKQDTLEAYQKALIEYPIHYQYLERISFEEGAKWQQELDAIGIQDLKNRLDIINESSTKTIKLIENLQKRNYNDMQEYATFCIELERQQSAQLSVEDWYKHIKNK